jgi:hypothetical protein
LCASDRFGSDARLGESAEEPWASTRVMAHRELDKPTEGSGGVSGSKKCKTNARTGSQDITNGRVAEMIELAAILTNHPDAAEQRAALARIADELLRNRSDATIEQAIEAAPSCGIAQTLQRAMEVASERVVIYRDGVRAELSLFAIPIITTFEQNVPESQFESAVSDLDGLRGLAPKMKDGRLKLAQARLVPKLFRLDDLNIMPLSILREHGINFGMGAVNGGSEWHPYITQNRSLKRSTAFLRFLVGQRQVSEHEASVANEDGVSERLQCLTSQAIKRYLGLPCRVQAFDMGSFYEGLYAGMWLYQETRLDQLARATCEQTRRDKPLEARVVTYGRRHRCEVWLGFFAGDQVIGGHAYRLRLRPSEDPSGCVSRITSRLEAAGIKANALTEVPEERGFGRRIGRKVENSMVTIPI